MPKQVAHLVALLVAAVPLVAGAQGFSVDDVVQAELLKGWRTASGSQMAALHIHLAPHWKTYWRAPGDAGIPPSFDWSGSQNLASVVFHWPRPQVFELNGTRSVGYVDDLVLPVEFVPKDATDPVGVKARVEIGVCNDICVPVEFELNAALAGPGGPEPAIKAALAENPLPAKAAGLSEFSCAVSPIKDGLRLTARIGLPAQGGEEMALFETSDPAIWVGATSTKREGGELVAGADLVPSEAAPFVLDRSKLRITVLGAERAVELDGCPAG